MKHISPAVARPLNRAAAAVLDAASSCASALGFAAEAAEAWIDERVAVFDTRADVDDPELIDELEEDE